MVQASTTLGSTVTTTVGALGTGTTVTTHSPAFDNNFYNTGTGHLYVCGTNSSANQYPQMWQVAITSGTMGGTGAVAFPNMSTSAAPGVACSPTAEIYNTSTQTDWVFISIPASAATNACGSTTTGCLMNFPATAWTPNTSYALYQQVYDSTTSYQQVTTAGTSGSTTPTWNTTQGGTTPDGTVTWTNILIPGGFITTAIAAETGGTSGMVVDNVSAASQASSLYFGTLGATACSTTGGGNVTACAVKRTQSGLQ